MYRKTILASVAFAFAALIAAACSSDSSSSSTGGACMPAGVTADCESCVESKCSDAANAFVDACGGCTSNGTAACNSAAEDIGTCIGTTCSTECANSSTTTTGSSTSTGTSGGNTSVACTTSDANAGTGCVQTNNYPASAVDAFDSSCTQQGGMPSDTCSTDGLLGCCTIGGVSEACYYDDGTSSASDLETACTQETGTWSTSP